MNDPIPEKDKSAAASFERSPKWLRRLQKESWQAELLISGVSLYACLQFPQLIYELANIMLDWLPIEFSFAGYMICYANILAIALLTTFFFYHFALRAYWIGLIGLNSVFPKGYNMEDGMYSVGYKRLWVRLLPKVEDSIRDVDKVASTQFASAFIMLMLYGMCSISLSIIALIYFLLDDYLPSWLWRFILFATVGLYLLSMVFSAIAMNQRLKNNPRVQKWQYYIGMLLSYPMTLFLFKPINQLIFTFTSNAKSGRSMLGVIPFFLLATALSIYHLQASNIGLLVEQGKLGNLASTEETMERRFYLDQYDDKDRIFTPVLESAIFEGDYLKLFIPVLRNERHLCSKFSGTFQSDESNSDREAAKEKRRFYHDCYMSYHEVFVNGLEYKGSIYLHEHRLGQRQGLLAFIPRDLLLKDENLLEVKKLANPEGETYAHFKLPFYCSAPHQ